MMPPRVGEAVSASGEAVRLQRRLERERAARRQVEEIAEQATRDLYERQAELLLLEAVAVASNEASTIEEALQVAVDRICEHTRWPIGHVYLRASDTNLLLPTAIWHLSDPERYEAFRHVTMAKPLAAGEGLPGRVLASGEVVWIDDVTEDSNFPRVRQAVDLGVRAAFCFPVTTSGGVVAALEFFSERALPPEPSLLGLMAQVGTQLRRVVERTQNEEQLKRLGRQKRAPARLGRGGHLRPRCGGSDDLRQPGSRQDARMELARARRNARPRHRARQRPPGSASSRGKRLRAHRHAP